ncbi:MAG: alpha-fucosidase [Clostridiales bacterium]|nr:alpha-fucosidase [Clostridiales bacterium]
MSAFRKAAAQVVPSPRQKAFMEKPFYAFVHFSPNTYTGLEWGTGQEDPAIFNPTDLDCDEWVEAIRSAGMTGMVLTAKHHDGFCLWQTKYTDHSVKSSPWKGGKGDVVREAAEACRRGGIRFGFYLSPWDRHSPLYGTDAYNDYYKAQLTELLTQYGDIFYVWFDGACGEGPNGKKQEYDFEGYIDLIRKYQPNACIFNDAGPDIRWCGNESGHARYAEWMVVPHELCHRAQKQTEGALLPGTLDGIDNMWQDLGSMEVIQYSKGLCFCPAEVDMSIRPGWFYHPEEEPHSLERLMHTYMTSVGGSASFHLNIPPMPSGRFDPRDIARFKELGDALKSAFGQEKGTGKQITRTVQNENQCVYHITLPKDETITYVELREPLDKGQMIERFRINHTTDYGETFNLFDGTTVGSRRICKLWEPITLREMDVCITSSRDDQSALSIRLF